MLEIWVTELFERQLQNVKYSLTRSVNQVNIQGCGLSRYAHACWCAHAWQGFQHSNSTFAEWVLWKVSWCSAQFWKLKYVSRPPFHSVTCDMICGVLVMWHVTVDTWAWSREQRVILIPQRGTSSSCDFDLLTKACPLNVLVFTSLKFDACIWGMTEWYGMAYAAWNSSWSVLNDRETN